MTSVDEEIPAKSGCPISELNPAAIIMTIVLLEILKEPKIGVTLSEIYANLSMRHPGSEDDLLKALNAIKEYNPTCFVEGGYWRTPPERHEAIHRQALYFSEE